MHEPRFTQVDNQYVQDAIESTFVSSVGKYVDRFEEEIADYLGAKHAVATVNGSAALQVALMLAGVGKNDEVITQPLTFVATANAVTYNQAVPVFVDIDNKNLGLSPEALADYLDRNAQKNKGRTINKTTGRRIAAILPMHTFGLPCNMKKILEVADSWDIPVVEDSAEALGSKTAIGHCATLGQLGVLSFNGNKTITCGGGGAIITNDTRTAKRAKHLTTTAKQDHPWAFIHDEIGYNFRMPNLNAALACAQLSQLDRFLEDKKKLAQAYQRFFKSRDLGNFVTEPAGCTSNYWLNALIAKDRKHRDLLLEETNAAGVMTRPAWELMTRLKIYENCPQGPLKNALTLSRRIVNLPSSARINV